jgi:hypothetical protein
VLHELDYDDSDAPAIGLVPAGVIRAVVQRHQQRMVRDLDVVVHVVPCHAGAYWDGTKMIVAEDLGPDQDEAVAEFRDLLRERGED